MRGARRTTRSRSPRIRRGFELGINWVDTAPIYGLGHSEEVVGRALEGLAERPYVFTKASLLDGGDSSVRHNLKRDSLLREIEASLTRLRVDVIDLYQVHWPDPDEDVEEGWSTLRRAQGAGARAPHRRVELRRRAAAPGAGRSRRSRRCSRPTRCSSATSRTRSCPSPSARGSA